MSATAPLVNAWIFLDDDWPSGTGYYSPTSCYQTLIRNNVYQAVDFLFMTFVTTVPTSPTTVPPGDGSFYTIETSPKVHPGGLTDLDYMKNIIRDARASHPGIKFGITLDYGDPGDQIARIFSNRRYSPQQNADAFAANLVAYLKAYGLDGFDIDWERSVCYNTPVVQFDCFVNAIGAQFRKQADKHYYLTISPALLGNMDSRPVNEHVDFINLQLYGGMDPGELRSIGVNPALFAYGAQFEAGYQTAQQAYADNQQNYHFSIFTNWRLNSSDFDFEQAQQKELYRLVYAPAVTVPLPAELPSSAPEPAA